MYQQSYYPYYQPQPGSTGWGTQVSAQPSVPVQTGGQGVPPSGSGQPAAGAAGQHASGQGTGGTVAQQSPAGQQMPTYGPLIDVVEHPRSVEVYIDIPGFDEDDIQLDADVQTLRVVAERDVEEPDDAVTIQRERPPRVERTISIPVRVQIDEAEASYEAGVCRVSLPKSEAAERTHTRIGFH